MNVMLGEEKVLATSRKRRAVQKMQGIIMHYAFRLMDKQTER